ncbi:apoptosis regulator BAX-like isoform X2 [Archocentrus centrarchus]|uniref:apoptosis regulator BAX-like isoform X2 n=1 Tax=Archocentrus centrarchus TaxID=63155 RepID=UPI0011EA3450|nr:apoptosis regulator BAX-like isoform X2 [Archocentrus centrarchus]
MACEGNDERIGEALIKEVIEEELKDVPSEDIPPLTPLTEVKTEQEKKMVMQLSKMIRIIGDRVQDDKEFQDVIDGVASAPGSKSDNFRQVANKVFADGITWEKIAVLIYVAGRLAVKMVEARLPQSVREVLSWTVSFFRNNLLSWVQEHGGWINSFSELAVVSMQSVSVSSHSYGLIIIFIAGMAIGSLITWRLSRQS